MNHAGALSAAEKVDALAGHFEKRGGCFRARVRGADSQREFGEGARGRAAVARQHRKGAKDALNAVKVEFLESPFGSIFPSEEDGHLVVNTAFIKEAELEAVYLDVILSLNFIKLAAESAPAGRDWC